MAVDLIITAIMLAAWLVVKGIACTGGGGSSLGNG